MNYFLRAEEKLINHLKLYAADIHHSLHKGGPSIHLIDKMYSKEFKMSELVLS